MTTIQDLNIKNLCIGLDAMQQDHEYANNTLAMPKPEHHDALLNAVSEGRINNITPDQCQWCIEGIIGYAIDPEHMAWRVNCVQDRVYLTLVSSNESSITQHSQLPDHWWLEYLGAERIFLVPELNDRSDEHKHTELCVLSDREGKESWPLVVAHWMKLRDARLSG